MKNFSDLLAIDSWLDIEIATANGQIRLRWPLLINLDLCCQDPKSILIDGMEVIEYGFRQRDLWRIKLSEPFYRWRHRKTGQGWLLFPQNTAKTPHM